MQLGALWSITSIKGGSKSSSEPETSHSQEAQLASAWPPCTQPPPPRGPPGLPATPRPPGLAAGLPPSFPRPPAGPSAIWHLVQVAAEGHLRVGSGQHKATLPQPRVLVTVQGLGP